MKQYNAEVFLFIYLFQNFRNPKTGPVLPLPWCIQAYISSHISWYWLLVYPLKETRAIDLQ